MGGGTTSMTTPFRDIASCTIGSKNMESFPTLDTHWIVLPKATLNKFHPPSMKASLYFTVFFHNRLLVSITSNSLGKKCLLMFSLQFLHFE